MFYQWTHSMMAYSSRVLVSGSVDEDQFGFEGAVQSFRPWRCRKNRRSTRSRPAGSAWVSRSVQRMLVYWLPGVVVMNQVVAGSTEPAALSRCRRLVQWRLVDHRSDLG